MRGIPISLETCGIPVGSISFLPIAIYVFNLKTCICLPVSPGCGSQKSFFGVLPLEFTASIQMGSYRVASPDL